MANWYGSARTNYFRVKDETKFLEWAAACYLRVLRDKEGRFGLTPEDNDDGGWPGEIYNEEKDEYTELELPHDLAPFLQEGSVAVFVEAGAEKLRYISGHAFAVNSEGHTKEIHLSDIYKVAADLGSEVTQAEY